MYSAKVECRVKCHVFKLFHCFILRIYRYNPFFGIPKDYTEGKTERTAEIKNSLHTKKIG